MHLVAIINSLIAVLDLIERLQPNFATKEELEDYIARRTAVRKQLVELLTQNPPDPSADTRADPSIGADAVGSFEPSVEVVNEATENTD